MTGRIAVGVSGAGSNLRALAAAAGRGELGGEIVLVFADRACPALDWAAEQGIDTALVPGRRRRGARRRPSRPSRPGRRRAGRLHADRRAGRPGRLRRAGSSTPTRRCCPRSRARTPSRDALAARRRGDRLHGPPRRRHARRRPDRRPGGRRRSCPATTWRRSTSGSARSSTGCCRAPSALLLAGALSVDSTAVGSASTWTAADRAVPQPRRALLSVSDKTGLAEFAAGLVAPRLRAGVDRRAPPGRCARPACR